MGSRISRIAGASRTGPHLGRNSRQKTADGHNRNNPDGAQSQSHRETPAAAKTKQQTTRLLDRLNVDAIRVTELPVVQRTAATSATKPPSKLSNSNSGAAAGSSDNASSGALETADLFALLRAHQRVKRGIVDSEPAQIPASVAQLPAEHLAQLRRHFAPIDGGTTPAVNPKT